MMAMELSKLKNRHSCRSLSTSLQGLDASFGLGCQIPDSLSMLINARSRRSDELSTIGCGLTMQPRVILPPRIVEIEDFAETPTFVEPTMQEVIKICRLIGCLGVDFSPSHACQRPTILRNMG